MPYKTKEEKRLYDIEYRKRNAEKIKQRQQSPEYFEKKRKWSAKYAAKTKEEKRLYDAEYRKRNLEERKLKNKLYYEANKGRISEVAKKYREKNRTRINEYHLTRKKNDPLYKLTTDIRTRIGQILRKNGYKKLSKTEQILGCTYKEFKTYLESKFEPWMNWENRGLYNGSENYGWDIDHIIPLTTAKCEADIIRLNHYTNLQPLCSYINRDVKKHFI